MLHDEDLDDLLEGDDGAKSSFRMRYPDPAAAEPLGGKVLGLGYHLGADTIMFKLELKYLEKVRGKMHHVDPRLQNNKGLLKRL